MFVGRTEEIEVLVRSLREGRPMVVVGPPGIGKSTLAVTAAKRFGPDLVFARGIATLTSVPYLLFRNRVHIVGDDEPDDVANRFSSLAPGPVVLDDLQWADPASLDVVDQIASSTRLLATVRAGTPGSESVLGRLDQAGFVRIDLTGLSADDARALARSRHPTIDDEALEAIVDAAEGSPLLLTELGIEPVRSPTLTAALLQRLDQLPPAAREAMFRLSVLRRPASIEELGDAANHLTRAGLAHHREGRFEVHHGLLAELVLDQLGVEADQVRSRLAPLVTEFEAALLLGAAGRREDARERALRAAEQATSTRDRLEALIVAVANAPVGEVDVELRVEAGQLLNDFGRSQESLDLVTLEGQIPDSVTAADRGRLIGVAAYAHWVLGDTRGFAELMEEALEHLRGSRTGAEVRVMAGSTMYATWVDLDGRSALDRATEAVALADEIGQERAFARVRLAAVLSTSGLDGWVELYQEALDLAEAVGDVRNANEAANSLVLAQWTRGDAHEARKVAARQLEVLSPDDHPQHWYMHAATAAALDMLLGVDPEVILERWHPVLTAGPPFRTRPFMEAAVVIALADLGRDREAEEVSRDIVRRASKADQWQAVAHWVLAESAWLRLDLEALVGAIEGVERLGIGDYPPAVMARLLGAHTAVEFGTALPGNEPVALTPAWAGAPVEWRALVAELDGRHLDAVALFDQAAALYVDHDERARLRCEWAAARALQRGGDDAVDRLVAVEASADQRGSKALLRRIHPLLRRSGVARSAPSGRTAAGLTAREHEVLVLVGQGRTSPQIAAELGITRDTVNDLVRSAMRRLGVTTRTAAVAKLRELESGPRS